MTDRTLSKPYLSRSKALFYAATRPLQRSRLKAEANARPIRLPHLEGPGASGHAGHSGAHSPHTLSCGTPRCVQGRPSPRRGRALLRSAVFNTMTLGSHCGSGRRSSPRSTCTLTWSGWRDSNSRPPAPKAGALTKLRHIPSSQPKPTLSGSPGTERGPQPWAGSDEDTARAHKRYAAMCQPSRCAGVAQW